MTMAAEISWLGLQICCDSSRGCLWASVCDEGWAHENGPVFLFDLCGNVRLQGGT